MSKAATEGFVTNGFVGPDTTIYGSALSLGEGRKVYFEHNGFGQDGGYNDKWVKALDKKWLKLYIPNSPGRVRAVRFHDLHHVLTGYETSLTGEGEVSAWELATGCADHYAAWFLNLSAMAFVLSFSPKTVFQAFIRGRHSSNLYREDFGEQLLGRNIGECRQEMGLLTDPPEATSKDIALFIFFAAVGWLVSLLQIGILCSPLILLALWLWPGA